MENLDSFCRAYRQTNCGHRTDTGVCVLRAVAGNPRIHWLPLRDSSALKGKKIFVFSTFVPPQIPLAKTDIHTPIIHALPHAFSISLGYRFTLNSAFFVTRTKKERPAPASLLASGGQEHGDQLGSNGYPDLVRIGVVLSIPASPRRLPRPRNRQAAPAHDQQGHATRDRHRRHFCASLNLALLCSPQCLSLLHELGKH
jgi:hypothetical protein